MRVTHGLHTLISKGIFIGYYMTSNGSHGCGVWGEKRGGKSGREGGNERTGRKRGKGKRERRATCICSTCIEIVIH